MFHDKIIHTICAPLCNLFNSCLFRWWMWCWEEGGGIWNFCALFLCTSRGKFKTSTILRTDFLQIYFENLIARQTLKFIKKDLKSAQIGSKQHVNVANAKTVLEQTHDSWNSINPFCLKILHACMESLRLMWELISTKVPLCKTWRLQVGYFFGRQALLHYVIYIGEITNLTTWELIWSDYLGLSLNQNFCWPWHVSWNQQDQHIEKSKTYKIVW